MENQKYTLTKETELMVDALNLLLRAETTINASLATAVNDEYAEKTFSQVFESDFQSLKTSIKIMIGDLISHNMLCLESKDI